MSNPNVKPAAIPPPTTLAPVVAPKPYVPPKDPPVCRGFLLGPGPEGKNDTYTLWYVETKAEKILKKELLQICYFGITEVIDAINNFSFDIFFLKVDPGSL